MFGRGAGVGGLGLGVDLLEQASAKKKIHSYLVYSKYMTKRPVFLWVTFEYIYYFISDQIPSLLSKI